MFGKSINSNDCSHGVFESNVDSSSVSLGVILAHLVGRHLHSKLKWIDNVIGKSLKW